MDDWPQWRSKIIEFGKVESSTRPNIKKVLEKLEGNDDKEGMLLHTIIIMVMFFCTYRAPEC